MKNLKLANFVIFISCLVNQSVVAQDTEIEPAEIESKYALFQDTYRNKQYKAAKESMEWGKKYPHCQVPAGCSAPMEPPPLDADRSGGRQSALLI